MKIIEFTKTRSVNSPMRGHSTDAGIDFWISWDMEWESFTIAPQVSLLIDSGIKMNIPPNVALIALEKSSIATKGLIIGAKVVDAGYTGNIHIHLINASNKNVTVSRGQKIAQFILLPIISALPVEVDQKQYELFGKTSRGEGGFGSTGQ